MQMERDRSIIEQQRHDNLQNAQRMREQMKSWSIQEARNEQKWMDNGRDLALADRERRVRIREIVNAKAQRVAEQTALQKQEELELERNLHLVRDRILRDKRRGAAALRAATSDDVIETSRRYAQDKRRELAMSTRNATQTWREERTQSEKSHLARARANKAAAEASRKRAKELREKLEARRRTEATAARERRRRDVAEREKATMHASGGKLDAHDAVYRERYVPKAEAERMAKSPYLSSVASAEWRVEA